MAIGLGSLSDNAVIRSLASRKAVILDQKYRCVRDANECAINVAKRLRICDSMFRRLLTSSAPATWLNARHATTRKGYPHSKQKAQQ
jgi:hypothetical protein